MSDEEEADNFYSPGEEEGRIPKIPKVLHDFISTRKERLSSILATGESLTAVEWPDFIIRPPNPTLHEPQDEGGIRNVFSLCSVVFWVPEIFWRRFVPYMPCPQCGRVGSDVKANGWNGNIARPVVGMFETYFLVCKKYVCRRCKRRFVGYDDGVMQHLPQFISAQFPCMLTRKAAVDLGLLNYVEITATTGQSFDEMSSVVSELHKLQFYKDMLIYYGFICERNRGQQSLVSAFQRQVTGSVVPAPNFGTISENSRYCCTKLLTGRYFAERFTEFVDSKREWMQNRMSQTIGGRVLCGDHTFKIASKIYVMRDGKRVYTSVYTIMNEFREIVVQYICRTKSEKEVKGALQQLVEDGMSLPEVWYTDTCCTTRKVIHEVFGGGVQVRLDPYHFMDRYNRSLSKHYHIYHFMFLINPYLERTHSKCKDFMKDLRDAIFKPVETDVAFVQAAARRKLPPSDFKRLQQSGYFNKHVRRLIPGPAELEERLNNLIRRWGGTTCCCVHSQLLLGCCCYSSSSGTRHFSLWITQRRK